MPKKPLLLGHRGARSIPGIPENTIAAFDFALTHGCDGFEFDVRRTADGTPVVCHNPTVRRRNISRTSDERLDFLPRLEPIFARYASRAFLDIELKADGMESTILALLKQHPPERGYIVSSFLPEILIELRRLSKAVRLAYICENERYLPLWRKLPCDSVILHQRLVTSKLIGQAHASGKEIMVWTVNSPAKMKLLAGLRVDGLISDNPERLCRILGREPET